MSDINFMVWATEALANYIHRYGIGCMAEIPACMRDQYCKLTDIWAD
jgi:hypothetical protein